jgi:excisionase family DNA binding protein
MNNPFETIDARLSNIENILLDLKHFPIQANNPGHESNDLLTIKEAAKYLSLSVPTIYGLVSRSEVPCMKLKKRLYFSRLELTNYIKSGRKKTVTEIQVEAGKYLIDKRKG